jgi:hypothetical protein
MVIEMAKDIIGIHGKNGEHYCLECIPDDLFREVTLDSLITRGEVRKEDSRYFCDTCKKLITDQALK